MSCQSLEASNSHGLVSEPSPLILTLSLASLLLALIQKRIPTRSLSLITPDSFSKTNPPQAGILACKALLPTCWSPLKLVLIWVLLFHLFNSKSPFTASSYNTRPVLGLGAGCGSGVGCGLAYVICRGESYFIH